jgi:hypothetical protein
MGAPLDVRGQRFGRLVAVAEATDERGARAWKCQCDCGEVVIRIVSRLRRGIVRSCGCLKREHMATHFRSCRTHGMSDSPEYTRWLDMKRRCDTPSQTSYKNYGARGITVSERWKSFEAFFQDMGPLPTPDHTLERKNTNGNYEPENCVWLPSARQANNTRRNRTVDFRGQKMTLADAIRASGKTCKYSTIHARIDLRGMSFEEAINTN